MTANQERSTGRRSRTLVAALSAATAAPMPILLAGTLAVQLREEIGVDEQRLGLAVTIFFLGSTAFSVLAGRSADRLGWRSAMRIGVAASGLSLLLVALLARNMATFVAVLLIGSLGHSFANPAGARALSEEMPSDRLGFVFGVKQAANPVAGMFAGASVPVLALSVGWRWAFAGAAIFPLLAWIGSSTPHDGDHRPRPSVGGVGRASVTLVPTEFRRAPIVALAVAGGLATLGASALSTFVVLTVVESGLSSGTAGTFVLVAAFLGMCVRVGSGWLADRVGSGGIRPIVVMLLVGAISFLMLATGSAALALPATILAYAGGWGWPGLFMFGIVHYHREAAGRATGLVQIGMMLGGAVAPVLFGFVLTQFGYATAWVGMAGIALAGAVVTAYAAHALERPTAEEMVAH